MMARLRHATIVDESSWDNVDLLRVYEVITKNEGEVGVE
jgi:hypothetical protein